MFYLSERKIVKGLIAAHERGVKLRILLDPNKDAFGREKNGIPNRQVASELHKAGIPVRWCNTQGEQCHNKILMKYGAQQSEMILGSANFTARNLKIIIWRPICVWWDNLRRKSLAMRSSISIRPGLI